MRVARPQDRRDPLVRIAIEDEPRVVHVLADVGVVSFALLVPMHRIIRSVQVQPDALETTCLPALGEVHVQQRAGVRLHGMTD